MSQDIEFRVARDQRVRELEAQLEEYRLQDSMLRHAYENSGRASELTWSGWMLQLVRDNAALQWTPITESNLPKVGDEVWRVRTGVSGEPWKQVEVVVSDDDLDYAEWIAAKYTHRRSLNLPIAAPPNGESLGVKK